jgi:hypothetical protein
LTPQQSTKPTAGSAAGSRASVALAGMAATLSMPAGAAIVSVADLEHVITSGESYSIPGLPRLEFSVGQYCVDKACTSFHPWAGAQSVWTWGPTDANGKTSPTSGGYLGLGVSVGDVIGPGGFIPTDTSLNSALTGVEDAYLGISVFEGDETHYGWVHFSVPNRAETEFVIHGFGYNDEAGASIRAGQTTDIPEPGTLALLAAGAVGVAAGSARRRRARA